MNLLAPGAAACSLLVLGLHAQAPLRGGDRRISASTGVGRLHHEPIRPNIVVIVLDDVGIDKIGAYGQFPAGSPPPCTPNIDQVAQDGLIFRNAYANPVCSPTRATLLTGRYGFRTGIGLAIVPSTDTRGLSVQYEDILPEVLLGYASSAVGKWHLSARNGSLGTGQGLQHPLNSGFGHYSGSMFNLDDPAIDCGTGCTPPSCGLPLGYGSWVKTSDPTGSGVLEQTCATTYATTDTADAAIARVQTMRPPWLLYAAFNAAHPPVEDPPPGLCHPPGTCSVQYCPSSPTDPLAARYNAMVEALDVEIGRVLAAVDQVDPNAYVFVVGDNGTLANVPGGTMNGCFDPQRSKGTLYESGIKVPLLIRGPGVVPGEVPALVNTTDLFRTITELAGSPVTAEDSISLVPYLRGSTVPQRNYAYAEGFFPNQESPDDAATPAFQPAVHIRSMRNRHYKLLRYSDINGMVDEEFYNLELDPCESIDLCPGVGPCDPALLSPDARVNYAALKSLLTNLGVYP